MDTICEKLAWFAFDNRTRSLNESLALRFGHSLAGAVFLDLVRLGALIAVEEDNFQPSRAVALKKSYLTEAFKSLSSLPSFSQEEALEHLACAIVPVKSLLLQSLQKEGFLKVGTSKLKGSFALKSYSLKAGKKGIRRKFFKALMEDKIQLADFWVLQFALTGNFLSGGTFDKKAVATAGAKIQLLSGLAGNSLVNSLAARILEPSLSDNQTVLDEPLKGVIWEWRGFWPGSKETTLIQTRQFFKQSPKQSPENFTFEETRDVYLLLDSVSENVKCREGALEIKCPVKRVQGYTAFLPKQTYPFPLAPELLHRLFTRLVPDSLGRAIRDIAELQQVLAQAGYRPRLVEVRKKRFVLKLKNRVQIEFCALNVEGKKYLSACVESPVYDLTRSHAFSFQAAHVQVINYVEFLQAMLKEPVI